MTILHSCCCWKSVRPGSIACGVYTGIYYTVNAVQSAYLLHEEIRFISNRSKSSLVDHDLTSGTLIFALSSTGVVSTVFLFYGIFRDLKCLLLPWICNMTVFTIVDVFYIIHGLLIHALQWNPSVAILITIDFFLNALNLYAILCVISQYQEYKAGRGKHLTNSHLSSSHQQVGASGLTVRKPAIFLDRKCKATGNPAGKPKKTVKFGDGSNKSTLMVPPLWDEPKLASNGFDTAPLIDTNHTNVHVGVGKNTFK
ncbi:hypothetical protein HUJ05_009267 [Dendroctonus ponderosae]|nr:hypothetical protein HUJ05_009267 [Dendroctonus ponderosae]